MLNVPPEIQVIFLNINELNNLIQSLQDKLRLENQKKEPEEQISSSIKAEFDKLMEYYGTTQQNYNTFLDKLRP